ncbi:type II toxin-antitoxin system VapC family toxin [Geomonas propionica]|uniref:Ribonuclease VapC n=1 Tax=Geomonas propionica TaxID=2798582 RepID=A0ABS0YM47_9BACT|nr:type II toxin-antitoxin system VapC family toxin [Geomonas propionica]MBJ6798984.1 type II toxin-antitoxin system VapC family toxin [Geomonas propionica]
MDHIVLDTNVLSELMRPQPNQCVMEWFAKKVGAVFYISAVTRAEILLGIALLPAGKKRDALAAAAAEMFNNEFAGRCLSFDETGAERYAQVVGGRRSAGLATSTEDALIAATALGHSCSLATRNIKDFQHIEGLILHDPWNLKAE